MDAAQTVDPLLTPIDVARILRRSRSSIYDLIRAGEIPVVRIGRRGVRVRPETLEAYIREREGAA